jgi:hypothetical protein
MDYDNPQFVAAVRKIIHDLFRASEPRVNTDETQHNTDNERDNAPIATVTELRTQIPIRVQTKTDESKAERVWKWAKGLLEVLGILAVILYTVLANKQWHEMISARHQTQGAIEATTRATGAAEAANKDAADRFRIDQRPYMWIVTPILPAKDPKDGYYTVNIHYKNYGKSPAIKIRTDFRWEIAPNAMKNVRYISKIPFTSKNSTIQMPNGNPDFASTKPFLYFSDTEAQQLITTEEGIVAYGRIDYTGTDGTEYWSLFCMFSQANGALSYCHGYNEIH